MSVKNTASEGQILVISECCPVGCSFEVVVLRALPNQDEFAYCDGCGCTWNSPAETQFVAGLNQIVSLAERAPMGVALSGASDSVFGRATLRSIETNDWGNTVEALNSDIAKQRIYRPPESVEELVRRYAEGERNFPNTELSESNLSGLTLDGASFDRFSWFFDSNFEGASLVGVSFRLCNLKCASFRGANLTGASFELAAIESIVLEGAQLSGSKFLGATFYGYSIKNADERPWWPAE
jgi:hypothetical protein